MMKLAEHLRTLTWTLFKDHQYSKKRKKSPLCSPCHTCFRLERPGRCPTNMSWFVCTCKKITSELLKFSALKAFIGYFFTIRPTYTMFARTDGIASNNINFFYYLHGDAYYFHIHGSISWPTTLYREEEKTSE